MKRIAVTAGAKYGGLSVVSEVPERKRRMFVCRCDCGTTVTVDFGNLRSGHTTSCGCTRLGEATNRLCIANGERYGRLVVTAEAEPHRSPSGQIRRKILCQCDCGNRLDVWLQHLQTGHTTSCGCLLVETRGDIRRTHGQSESSTYRIWSDMKNRCQNKENTAWEWYGGRGIAVCARWQVFEHFLEDMGERPAGLTLDRIDTNGNYDPRNCRWVTMKEQARNTRANQFVTVGNETRCIAEWSEITGVSGSTIRNRLKAGCTAAEAIRRGDNRLAKEPT